MPNSLNISEARAKLPQIAQSLIREPGSVVYIEHRDLDERLAFTTESHLRYLETMVSRLRAGAAGSFSLAGSIQTDLTPEQLEAALTELRSDAGARLTEKLDSL
jgi:hypothetical protein